MNAHRTLRHLLLPLSMLAAGCDDITITLKPDGLERALEQAQDGELDVEIDVDTAAVGEQLDALRDGCGAFEGDALRLTRLELLVDPVDAAGQPWDTGRTEPDFDAQRAALTASLDALADADGTYDPDELLMGVYEEHISLLGSTARSPDLAPTFTALHGAELSTRVADDRPGYDQNLIRFADVELGLSEADQGLLIELHDIDSGADPEVGWVVLDRAQLRRAVGCGPQVEVYTDVQLERAGSRIRAMGIEVEAN